MTKDSVSSSDEIYYVSLKKKLSVYTYGISKLNSIEFKSPTSDTTVRYKPNEKFNLGIGFNYRWAGLSAAFNMKFINNDDNRLGKSTSFDIQSDLYSRKFLSTINLQAYKGFYWENVNRYDTTWSIRDSMPVRPDITTVNMGFNTIFSFNFRKFSLKAPYVHTEWQKKSAGSWLVGWHISLYSLVSGAILIPEPLRASFPVFDQTMHIVTANFGGSIGYSYTLVMYEEFYLNALLMLGMSMQSFEAFGDSRELIHNDIKPTTRSLFRLAFGSNNEKCYYGVSLIAESFPIRNSFQSQFVYNYGRLRIFYGRRFNLSGR
jgi:hypothetical protein